MKSEHALKNYLKVFGALLVLTVLTVVAAYIDLGPLGIPVALAIAITKAALVIAFFMHLVESDQLTRLFVFSGFLWLLILFGITMTDYLDRDWTLKYTPRKSWITKSPSHFDITAVKKEVQRHES